VVDPDAIPEPPDAAITQPGDLVRLGRHCLLCGDSAAPEAVNRLLDGAKIHLLNTDPPYNARVETKREPRPLPPLPLTWTDVRSRCSSQTIRFSS
jgi:hypothetical protein